MRRAVLLALLALALPTAALADSFEFANFGTVSSSTASISGSFSAGPGVTLSSALTNIFNITTNTTICGGSVACSGSVVITTGALSTCGSNLCFSGGSISISNNGSTLFTSSLSGTVQNLGNNVFVLNAALPGSGNGTAQLVSLTVGSGAISGDTIASVPEPGTLGLLGTGLVGLAGIVRRKMRG